VHLSSRFGANLRRLGAFVAVATFLFAGVASRAADTSYLKEMPPAQRVIQQIKGGDERDTAAKQAAAIQLLIRMMDVRIGDVNANLNQGTALSPPERQLMQSYYAAARAALAPVQAKLGS